MKPIEMNLRDIPESDITCDPLTNRWKIFQLRKGHRFSTDDLFTADVALQLRPDATSYCDLGSGLGTVGLVVLNSLSSNSLLTMIEAQQVSHQLAQRTIQINSLMDRVTAIHGDLRDDTVFRDLGQFHLVTGSPPYFPLGTGVISPHPQRAACRMELRGSIIDYANRAASLLTDDGVFVVCFSGQDPRAEEALRLAGLHLLLRQDVIFRADLPPTITVLAGQKSACKTLRPPVIVIRDENSQFTTEYMAMRHRLDAPI